MTDDVTAKQLPGQPDWYFCSKCFGMFYAGDEKGNMGRCPLPRGGTEGHSKYGFNFVLPSTLGPEPPGTQEGWRFCSRCFVMFYRAGGICPVGYDQHEVVYSFLFTLPHDVPESPGTQKDWRFCHKCYAMFYNGDTRGITGVCPGRAGGAHEAYGFNFVLPHTDEFYEPPAPTPPPKPEPLNPPVIAVTYNGSISDAKFHVTGSGFIPNLPPANQPITQGVAIRVAIDTVPQDRPLEYTASSAAGTIDYVVAGDLTGIPVNSAGYATIAISATDGRPNPDDIFTGQLWSNTVPTRIQ